jgi:hypothetical protein
MNSTAKVALAVGAGIVAAKVTGKWWWVALAGAGALFLVNAPETRASAKSMFTVKH